MGDDQKENSPKFSVTLSVYDWHKLLKELEYIQRICNRSREDVEDLWEQISTQLSGKEQIIDGSLKHYKFFPEKYITPTSSVESKKDESGPPKKVSWWIKLFQKKPIDKTESHNDNI